MDLSIDEKLDLWIESSVFRRSRHKRFGVPAYSRYLNRALGAIDYLDIPYKIERHEDMRWRVSAEGLTLLVDTADEIALAVCELTYYAVTGKEWPRGDSNA